MAGHVLLTAKMNPLKNIIYISHFPTRSMPQLWEFLFIKGFCEYTLAPAFYLSYSPPISEIVSHNRERELLAPWQPVHRGQACATEAACATHATCAKMARYRDTV